MSSDDSGAKHAPTCSGWAPWWPCRLARCKRYGGAARQGCGVYHRAVTNHPAPVQPAQAADSRLIRCDVVLVVVVDARPPRLVAGDTLGEGWQHQIGDGEVGRSQQPVVAPEDLVDVPVALANTVGFAVALSRAQVGAGTAWAPTRRVSCASRPCRTRRRAHPARG